MDGLPVTLIVKAPNQQIEDQTIKCQLTWTIQELKGHLSEVYPLKPKKEEQKLIYSGQLLTDSVVLKDVLRRYEGQDIHTVHLVCAMPQTKHKSSPSSIMNPENPPQGSSGTSTVTGSNSQPAEFSNHRMNDESSGLRHRQTNQPYQNYENYWRQENDRQEPRLYFPQDMQFAQTREGEGNTNTWNNTGYQTSPYINTAANNFSPVPMQINDPVAFAAAHMAWMQQIQAQYLQFYAQAMQTATTSTQSMQLPTDENQPQIVYNVPEAVTEEAPAPAEEELPNQDLRLNRRRFNHAAFNDDNWDWLDWFYMASRVCIMFAIIYFYSSPMRFIIVLLTTVFIYLYQIRYFHALVQNNNGENVNNNNAPRVNNNVGEQQNEPVENAENPETVPPENVTTDNRANEVVQENQPSYLAITWTVITSFLTSLFPDAPNAI